MSSLSYIVKKINHFVLLVLFVFLLLLSVLNSENHIQHCNTIASTFRRHVNILKLRVVTHSPEPNRTQRIKAISIKSYPHPYRVTETLLDSAVQNHQCLTTTTPTTRHWHQQRDKDPPTGVVMHTDSVLSTANSTHTHKKSPTQTQHNIESAHM